MGLGGAIGAEHEHSALVGRSCNVAEQQQRRPVGPLQVVEHEQDRRRRGDLGQQAGHGLEQPVALGLRLALDRRRQLGRAPAQLGNEPGQLGAVLARAGPQLTRRGAHEVVAQRLDERLVGDERLLGRSAGEHESTVVVGAPGDLGHEPRLADTWVAGQQHDAAAIALGNVGGRRRVRPRLLPEPFQVLELLDPAHHGRSAARHQLGRERDPGRGLGILGTVVARRTGASAASPSCARPGSGGAAGPGTPGSRVQQPLVRGDRLRRGSGAELITQQRAHALEDPHGLGHVALGGQRLHQQDIAGFPVGL